MLADTFLWGLTLIIFSLMCLVRAVADLLPLKRKVDRLR